MHELRSDSAVRIIWDEYGIYRGEGRRVRSFADEKRAFLSINARLRSRADGTTQPVEVFVLTGPSRAHFNSYLHLAGVDVRELTPRGVLQERVGCTPPEWLSSDNILEYGLVGESGPGELTDSHWAATVAAWLFPGSTDTSSIVDFLACIAAAEEHRDRVLPAPLIEYLDQKLTETASHSELPLWATETLGGALHSDGRLGRLAAAWLECRALKPLMSRGSPLRDNSLEVKLDEVGAAAAKLPVPHPLPKDLAESVGKRYARSLRDARLEGRTELSPGLQHLEAVWPHAGTEIAAWIHSGPSALSAEAADYLTTLPGYQQDLDLQHVLANYAPPCPLEPWPGLGEETDNWIVEYSKWVGRSFHRRNFPNWSEDPAQDFGRWLLREPTVVLNHARFGYTAVAARVREALEAGRRVLLVVVDALAIQFSDTAITEFSALLGEAPTDHTHALAPIPTITSVCKEAVITGAFPSSNMGNPLKAAAKAYGLRPECVCVLKQWSDAEIRSVDAGHQLVIYLDNRIDDLLSSERSYRTMLETAKTQLSDIARTTARLSQEIQHQEGEPPLVLVTADHGFTYGLSSKISTVARELLETGQRCTPVSDPNVTREISDGTIAFLDSQPLKLRTPYLAALSRTFGSGTASGWKLSHGGLLPEEVIIPILEWFGMPARNTLPKLVSLSAAHVARGFLRATAAFRNPTPRPSLPGRLIATLRGEAESCIQTFGAVRPRETLLLEISIPYAKAPRTRADIDTTMESHDAGSTEQPRVRTSHSVEVRHPLAESTDEQDAFEDMF